MIDEEATASAIPDPPKSRRLGLLIAAAVALVVVPAVIGVFLLADDPETDGGGDGMGGSGTPPAGDGTAQVFSLDEILDSDITVEVADDSSSAVIRVNTTIDVVCGASYGPTTSLGGLSTDTDMAGGGHRIHQPRLTGLQPDTEYFYRLQGVAADGRIFASDLLSFRTGVGGGTATPAPNVAVGATVTDVSSEFSASFAGANAVDGDLSTEWSSAGDGDDAYIVLDLGAAVDIKGVGFRTREMSDGTSITNSFTVSIDGQPALGPFEAGPGLAIAEFESTAGTTVRIDVATSTGGNTGAVEIEVYGSLASTQAPDDQEEDM